MLESPRPPTLESESHKYLRSAYKTIKDKLINDSISQYADVLDKLNALKTLHRYVTQQCVFIFLSSNERSEAFKLFSVLNDRGKSLSDRDLLRSQTLELLEHHQHVQSQMQADWDAIIRNPEADTDRFFRTYFPSHTGYRVGRGSLIDPFIKEFFGSRSEMIPASDIAGANDIGGAVVALRTEFDHYMEIKEGTWPFLISSASPNNWRRSRLERLILALRHVQCLPLLLAARASLDEVKFADLVHLLEIFSFRYISVCGGHANKLSSVYYSAAKDVRTQQSNYTFTQLKAELRALIASEANDADFKLKLKDSFLYGRSAASNLQVKYFLTTLEDYRQWFDNRVGVTPIASMISVLDLNNLEVEHIYPQTPALGHTDPVLEELKHNIANLAFWAPGENASAGNEPFIMKRTRYANSQIILTREISIESQWTPNEFFLREKRLIDMALAIFVI